MNALRFNPVLHAMQERLKERGKRRMVILGAAMRKLLHLAFGVLKSRKPFDPAIACPAYP
jgi:transposase